MSENLETMADKENKMDKLKKNFIRIQGKIQDRMDDIHDQVQNRIERSKISRFVSHISSEERSSVEDNQEEKEDGAYTECVEVRENTSRIPHVVVDEPPGTNQDPKDICKHFICIEKENVLYKKRSKSVTNLSYDDESNDYSSTDSCVSCLSSSDESTCSKILG
ncbi:uncharacterized protein LOC114243766 [Bombyx mandarina]|uniref:Uncharacterized protein LOC114243766 n=1 Tax=Bombyx mandarina TaxID=7092 RepID=A0A6J2JNQ4_BOMMA|nr:uncharacterized protein LOC114243766 [Bombyx mandarina]